MMLQGDNIRTLLFTVLCICFIFYLYLGIYSYKKDKEKVNVRFSYSCVCASLWAIGYAFMLISPNIEIANIWRIVSSLGWCFYSGVGLSFILSLEDTSHKKLNSKIQSLIYITSTIFFLNNLFYEPSKIVSSQSYGFINNIYPATTIGTIFSIYISSLYITGLVKLYYLMKISQKNRVKKQMKIILNTCLVTFSLGATTDLIFPVLGIVAFPSAIIIISITMSGMCYAINKHKMLSISYELVSAYLFEAVNGPVFILDEHFLVKNCNEVALNTIGYTHKELVQNSLQTVIDFRNFSFNTIMQTGYIISIEVDLLRRSKESLLH
jgi:hypothetical protein